LAIRAFYNPGTEGFDVFVCGGETMLLAAVADAHNGVRTVHKFRSELTQEDRIIEALGSVIPRVHKEPLSRYCKYLTEHLDFPFLAYFPKPATFQEEEDCRCMVLELLGPAKNSDDGVDGIFCNIHKGIYELTLPFNNLYLPEDSFNFQWFDDYCCWFWNWR